MNEQIKSPALYIQVADRLRAQIYRHELQPGDAIDEMALCARYGISRTPLREALKVLSSEGLIELIPHKGSFVRSMATDPINRTLVAAINDVGHAMGMRTVAEGAEDEATVAVLSELGVDYVQGFVVAKPRLLYRHSRAPKVSSQKLLAM